MGEGAAGGIVCVVQLPLAQQAGESAEQPFSLQLQVVPVVVGGAADDEALMFGRSVGAGPTGEMEAVWSVYCSPT